MASLNVSPGSRFVAAYQDLSAGEVRRLEELAYVHGRHYDSYLVTEPNRHYFWSRDNRGVAGMLLERNYLHVLGGLMAAPSERAELLRDLQSFAIANKLVIGLYGVAEEDVGLFREHGFQAAKVGEEGIVSLDKLSLSGNRQRWLRRQVRCATRQGVVVEEWREADHDGQRWPGLLAELAEVSDADLERRLQRHEPPGFYGRLLPGHLHRRRIFTARHQGRIIAFTVCLPGCDGTLWCPEMTRRRPDAVKGVTAFLWFHAMQRLRADGARWFTLGLTPGVGIRPVAGDSWVLRRLLGLSADHLPDVYNSHGIHAYKRRFRPDFRDLHVCVFPRISLGWCLSFLKLTGFFALKPGSWRRLLARKLLPA